MQELNLRVKTRKKFKVTTDSNHNFPLRTNELKRDFSAFRPNVKFVGDISYIWTTEGWLYLAIVIDLYSRKVKGWSLSNRIDAKLVTDAMEMAVKNIGIRQDCLFHSDRGSQYASSIFQNYLKKHNIKHSMSGKGDCWDNAVSESFFATLKKELIYLTRFATRTEAKTEIFKYIEVFYNRIRMHSANNYLSPEQFELAYVA